MIAEDSQKSGFGDPSYIRELNASELLYGANFTVFIANSEK